MSGSVGRMTRHELEAHEKLLKRREKILKAAVDARASERMDNFRKEITTLHKLSEKRWQPIRNRMREMQAELDAMRDEVCQRDGISERSQPGASINWSNRGFEYSWPERRKELEKAAEVENVAIKKADLLLVNMHMAELETKLLTGMLETPEGRAFLEAVPSFTDLGLPQSTAQLKRALSLKALPSGPVADESGEEA